MIAIPDKIKSNWKEILIVILIVCVAALGFYVFHKDKTPEIVTIPDTNSASVYNGMADAGTPVDFKTAEKISQKIATAETKPANLTFTTATQKEADTKIKEVAKNDKADSVLKKTETEANGQIENKYYGIHLERDNAIGVGATVLNQKAYMSLSYEHKNIEAIVHTKDLRGVDGATVMYKKRF